MKKRCFTPDKIIAWEKHWVPVNLSRRDCYSTAEGIGAKNGVPAVP